MTKNKITDALSCSRKAVKIGKNNKGIYCYLIINNSAYDRSNQEILQSPKRRHPETHCQSEKVCLRGNADKILLSIVNNETLYGVDQSHFIYIVHILEYAHIHIFS